MVRSEQQSSKRILYPTWKRVQVLKHIKKNPISDKWAHLREKGQNVPEVLKKLELISATIFVTTKRKFCSYSLLFKAHNISRTQHFNAKSCNIVGSCWEMLWRSWPNAHNNLTIFKLGPITSNKLAKRAQQVVRNMLQDVALKCYVRVAGPLLLKLVPHSLILYPSLQILLLLRSLLRLVEAVYNQFSSSPW